MSEEERLQLENELLMTCSKAQAINKYIDEFEECSRLSELWCKSQQEKQQLAGRINKAIEYIIKHVKLLPDEEGGGLELCDYDVANVLEILRGEFNERKRSN